MIRIVVDFPAPLGPRKPVTRPGWAVKLTSSTAVKLAVLPGDSFDGDHAGAPLPAGSPERRGRSSGAAAGIVVGDLVALDVDVRQQPVEPARQPPVAVAEQFHRGRDQHHPDDGGVDEDGGARPMPNILPKTSWPSTKERNTVTITAAPAVMTLADLARPSATASALSPVLSYSSLIRDSRNTS